MKKLFLAGILIVAVSAVVFVIGSRCRAAVDSTQVFVIETPKSYPAVDRGRPALISSTLAYIRGSVAAHMTNASSASGLNLDSAVRSH